MGVSCSVDATHHGSTFLIHRSLETPSTFDVRMDWVRLRGADDGGVRAHSYVTLPRHHTIVQLCVHAVVHRCHDTTPLRNCVHTVEIWVHLIAILKGPRNWCQVSNGANMHL